MNFNEYQTWAKTTDVFNNTNTLNAAQKVTDPAFIAKILGLTGEAGEVAEKFKKIIRDKNGELSEEDKNEIIKELGDVLWYISIIAKYMDVALEDVATTNIEKLTDRKSRNKLSGSGDNR